MRQSNQAHYPQKGGNIQSPRAPNNLKKIEHSPSKLGHPAQSPASVENRKIQPKKNNKVEVPNDRQSRNAERERKEQEKHDKELEEEKQRKEIQEKFKSNVKNEIEFLWKIKNRLMSNKSNIRNLKLPLKLK